MKPFRCRYCSASSTSAAMLFASASGIQWSGALHGRVEVAGGGEVGRGGTLGSKRSGAQRRQLSMCPHCGCSSMAAAGGLQQHGCSRCAGAVTLLNQQWYSAAEPARGAPCCTHRSSTSYSTPPEQYSSRKCRWVSALVWRHRCSRSSAPGWFRNAACVEAQVRQGRQALHRLVVRARVGTPPGPTAKAALGPP